LNIAVFASGRGSNFEAIVKAVRSGKVKANLALMLCDNPSASVILKAKRLKVKTVLIDPRLHLTKKSLEDRIIRHLKDNKIDLILLAGFMRILSPRFVLTYKNKIINIHPSLLPAFKGADAIKDAFDYGVKVTGVTVHFVDEKMDHGPIILQREIKIEETESLSSLEGKIHKLEHKVYPEVLRLFINKQLKIKGRKTLVINR
jgi:phosphoribosylglycinamide formyltransferase 1